tara:strand:+ start:185 stop:691 length:507 start_codon:yes stop_codon:yes gene_type:complete
MTKLLFILLFLLVSFSFSENNNEKNKYTRFSLGFSEQAPMSLFQISKFLQKNEKFHTYYSFGYLPPVGASMGFGYRYYKQPMSESSMYSGFSIAAYHHGNNNTGGKLNNNTFVLINGTLGYKINLKSNKWGWRNTALYLGCSATLVISAIENPLIGPLPTISISKNFD